MENKNNNNNKEIITEVAFLLAMKNGFNSASIKDIQKASGFSAGSIYYYFTDKDEILLYMINYYLVDNFHEYIETIRNFNGSFFEKIENMFYYLLDFNKKEFKSPYSSTIPEFNYKSYFGLFFSIFHHHPKIKHIFHKIHAESYDFHQELVKEAIENKEINKDTDVRALSLFIHTILKGYLYLCVFHPELSTEEIMNTNLKIIEKVSKDNSSY
jgi:AcrR family transcriptional regulator